MNILLIGSGGREHAMARSLSESVNCAHLWATPGNPGIFQHARMAPVDSSVFPELCTWCKTEAIDLVVIGPDQALADGMSDALRAANIRVFGASKAAARIEWSKAFAKELMQRAQIPTALARRFDINSRQEAELYVRSRPLPVVVKADGLALGKGVVVATSYDEAIDAMNEMFNGMFQEAGKTLIVEDFLQGEEASVFALCDGNDFVCLASAQDHKRALDGDLGKNTGGMGSYAPAPIVTPEVLAKVEQHVIMPLLKIMREDGIPFTGCLFVGLMIHNGEPSVVEFNARFGDPETQSVLSIFDGDFAKLCASVADEKLDRSSIRSVANGCACTVALVSGGYPDAYEKGFAISGIDEAEKVARVYHAGTKMVNDVLVTNGGRVLGVTAIADTLSLAIATAYQATSCIHFDKVFYRQDIGSRAMEKLTAEERA